MKNSVYYQIQIQLFSLVDSTILDQYVLETKGVFEWVSLVRIQQNKDEFYKRKVTVR